MLRYEDETCQMGTSNGQCLLPLNQTNTDPIKAIFLQEAAYGINLVDMTAISLFTLSIYAIFCH